MLGSWGTLTPCICFVWGLWTSCGDRPKFQKIARNLLIPEPLLQIIQENLSFSPQKSFFLPPTFVGLAWHFNPQRSTFLGKTEGSPRSLSAPSLGPVYGAIGCGCFRSTSSTPGRGACRWSVETDKKARGLGVFL